MIPLLIYSNENGLTCVESQVLAHENLRYPRLRISSKVTARLPPREIQFRRYKDRSNNTHIKSFSDFGHALYATKPTMPMVFLKAQFLLDLELSSSTSKRFVGLKVLWRKPD